MTTTPDTQTETKELNFPHPGELAKLIGKGFEDESPVDDLTFTPEWMKEMMRRRDERA